ncbi:GPCR fungal pheromone mating factor [Amylostereum chailletii]|nr:GPCR fungal pheromone mating factor [Amylostereum chailletii]
MDPTYPLAPVVNILAAFLVLLSLLSRSMIQAWNAGIVLLGCWLFAYAMVIGVDTVIWADNANNSAPIWCDIAIHVQVGASVGVPACSLIIARRLYKIISRKTLGSADDRQRAYNLAIDLLIGLGFPLIIMSLCKFFYIVQAERFAIYEEAGCLGVIYSSGVAILIIIPWQVGFSLITFLVYSPGILWLFLKRKRETDQLLQSNPTVPRSTYFRVMTVGCIDVITTLPLSIVTTTRSLLQAIRNADGNFQFWPGWSAIHDDWTHSQLLVSDWKTDRWNELAIRSIIWNNVPLSLAYFFLFGLMGEARATYRNIFWAVVRPFRWIPSPPSDFGSMAFAPGHSSGRTIPST